MTRAARTGRIEAAGVVAFDPRGHVAVVRRLRYDDWSLPKGKWELGEPLQMTAVREAFEETGTQVRLEAPLTATDYMHEGLDKKVYWWRARACEIAPRLADDEVDEVRWLDPETAAGLLTYDTDRSVLAEAVAQGPTSALVVLRHAQAVKRVAWRSGDARARHTDAERPLTADGLAQTDRVADLLGAYAIEDIVSSPSRRCRQTVEPYAARVGLALRFDAALTEESAVSDGIVALVADLLRALPRRSAICSHRPVMPLVTRALGEQVRRTKAGARLDPRLRPGRALVLHIGERVDLVAVERWQFSDGTV